MVPPMLRKNWLALVAMPSLLRSVVLCTASVNRLLVGPRPMPSTTISQTTVLVLVAGVRRLPKNSETVMSTRPPRMKPLYLPVRDTTCPASVLVTTSPSISGASTTPEFEALTPLTPCMNSGRYRIAPYMPAMLRNPAMFDTVKVALRNRPSSRIGLFVRVCQYTKETSMTAEPISSERMVAPPQA